MKRSSTPTVVSTLTREMFISRPLTLAMLGAATIAVAAVIGSYYAVAFSTGGDDGVRLSMTVTAVAALPPICCGIYLSQKSFFQDFNETFSYLFRLGVPRRSVKQVALIFGFIQGIFAAVVATLGGQAAFHLFTLIMLWNINLDLPDQLGGFGVIGLVSLATAPPVFTISALLGCQSALTQTTQTFRPRSRTRGLVGAFAAATLTIWSVYVGWTVVRDPADANPTKFVAVLIAAGCLSPLLLAPLVDRIVLPFTVRFRGWSQWSVAARSMILFRTLATALLTSFLTMIPMLAFTEAEISIENSRVGLKSIVTDASILAYEDGSLLLFDQAQDVCTDLGVKCAGIVSLVLPPEGSHQASYDISATTNEAVLRMFGGMPPDYKSVWEKEPLGTSFALYWAYQPPGSGATPVLGVPVLRDGAASPGAFEDRDLMIMDASEWAERADGDLFYGAYGTGTTGLIPTFAYLLLGCVIMITTLGTSRRDALRRKLDPLRQFGYSELQVKLTHMLVTLIPLALGVFGAWLHVILYSAFAPHAQALEVKFVWPYLPPGLVALTLLVMLTGSIVPAFLLRDPINPSQQ